MDQALRYGSWERARKKARSLPTGPGKFWERMP